MLFHFLIVTVDIHLQSFMLGVEVSQGLILLTQPLTVMSLNSNELILLTSIVFVSKV